MTASADTVANREVWENLFATRDWGRYPGEDLIRALARAFPPASRRESAVLEVGCGPGANIWYLAREGFRVAGIDGSPSAIAQARQRLFDEGLNGLSADLRCGDFARLPWPDGRFDAVVDIEAIYANPLAAIRATLAEVRRVLKPGGLFFAKMFGTETTGWNSGEQIEPNTSLCPADGPCAGLGISHFFSRDEIEALCRDFTAVDIDWTSRSDHGGRWTVFEWLVKARR
jgi:SAM-dependent methyltransferase